MGTLDVASHDWVNRAAEHDSDLASRRRERMEKELDRSKDNAVLLTRAFTLSKIAERIKGMDVEDLRRGRYLRLCGHCLSWSSRPWATRTELRLRARTVGRSRRSSRVRTAGRSNSFTSSSHHRKCGTRQLADTDRVREATRWRHRRRNLLRQSLIRGGGMTHRNKQLGGSLGLREPCPDLFYGGAAGPGKTSYLLMAAVQYVQLSSLPCA